MENSLSSSSPNKLSLQEEEEKEEEEAEESGWTQYLVDFSEENRERRKLEEEDNNESEYYWSASMASDAGSGLAAAGWINLQQMKNSPPPAAAAADHFHGNKYRHLLGSGGGGGGGCGFPPNNNMMNAPRKLNFKKKRITQDIAYDDDLEDTASSPANSPKIALGMKGMDINSRKTDHENFDHSHLGKGGCDASNIGDIAMDSRLDHQLMIARKIEDCTDLKQKGLCLAPVSMFIN